MSDLAQCSRIIHAQLVCIGEETEPHRTIMLNAVARDIDDLRRPFQDRPGTLEEQARMAIGCIRLGHDTMQHKNASLIRLRDYTEQVLRELDFHDSDVTVEFTD